MNEMLGRTFGFLVVIERSPRTSKYGHDSWFCRCARCGNPRHEAYGTNLRNGKIRACGCLSKGPRERTLRPTPPPVKGARWIQLTQGRFALVDAEDFDRVTKFNWSIAAKRYAAYRATPLTGKKNGSYVYLHRFVVGASDRQTVDHINHDELDNRKSNLRVASMSQQGQNRKRPSHNSSGLKGVYFDKSRSLWAAGIKVNKKKKFLGRFKDRDEAGRVYDAAARKFFGEFALPNSDPRIAPRAT